MSLWDWFVDPPSDRGMHVAGTDPTEWVFSSYMDIAALTRRAAWRLRDAGVAAGDVVAMARPAGTAFVADFFGALLIGATPAPVAPPMVFRDERRYVEHAGRILRSCGARTLTAAPGVAERLREMAAGLGVRIVDDITADTPTWDGPVVPTETAIIQHSSGSTSAPRGVRIPFRALQANLTAMRRWLGLTAADAWSTWLPMHHDMGLVGSLLLPMESVIDLWTMHPEQFIQSPLRWLRSFGPGRGTVTATPNLGLGQVARRVRPDDLAGLDLSGWRSAVVGAERIDHETLRRFRELLTPYGLRPDVYVPAYGMAESTLAVTGRRAGHPVAMRTVDAASLVVGGRIGDGTEEATGVTLVSCGHPLEDGTVRLVGPDGATLGEGILGEIEISGEFVAAGYTAGPAGPAVEFDGTFATGDAGFWHDGQLYVVGRLGDSVKQFGRWFFAEDAEQRAVAVSPVPTRTVALVGGLHGRNTAVVMVERSERVDAADMIGTVVARQANDLRVLVCGVPAGTIQRTTSGKPMRRAMWQRLVGGQIDTNVWWDSDDAARRVDDTAARSPVAR